LISLLHRYRNLAWLPLCLAAGCISVAMGQDASWDLQNYHLYNGFALLHPARWHDIQIAQMQSFLNPALDVPLDLLTALFPGAPRAVAFCMGLPYGVLAFFTLRIAARLFADIGPAAIAALLGLTGAATVSQIGLSTNEVLAASFIIAALDILLAAIAKNAALPLCLLAGLLAGLAAGGKLTALPYAIGVAAAAAAALPARRLIPGLGLIAAGGAAAAALTGGLWMLHLYRLYGNPIFPFDNQIFNSPWAGPWAYGDTRFFPHTTLQALFYPFSWARLNTNVVTEVPFADPRLAAVLTAAALAVLSLTLRRRLPPPAWRAVIAFFAVSYVLWEKLFSIYRYAVPLEVIGGMLCIGAIRAILPRPLPANLAACALTAAICLTTRYPDWTHIPFQTRAVPVTLPPIAPRTLIVSSDANAVAFVAVRAPKTAVFIGGDNNFYVPATSPLHRLITATIATWPGPIEILEPAAGDPSGRASLAANFSLAVAGPCRVILSAWNANGLQLCPARRFGGGPDDQPTLNLDFSPGANGLADEGAGWDDPEDWGSWSIAQDAYLNLPLNPRNRQKLQLTIFCYSTPSATSPGRHVDVYANGALVAHWALNRYPVFYTTQIPPQQGATTLRLRFHILDPITPADQDPRTLGIALQHLTLQQALN
jgi:hypothetical protein